MAQRQTTSRYQRESDETLSQFEIRSFWSPYVPWFIYGCVIGLVLFAAYLWLAPKDNSLELVATESSIQPLNTRNSDDQLGQVTSNAGTQSGNKTTTASSYPANAITPSQNSEQNTIQQQNVAANQTATADATAATATHTTATETATEGHPTFDFYTVLPEGEGGKLNQEHETAQRTPAASAVAAQTAPTATNTTTNTTAIPTVPTTKSATATATASNAQTQQPTATTTQNALAIAAASSRDNPPRVVAPIASTNAANTTPATQRKNQIAATMNKTNNANSARKLMESAAATTAIKANTAKAQPPQSSTLPELSAAEANKKVMLQIASFRSYKDAEELRAELLLQGFTAKIHRIEDQQSQQTLNRVLLGPYTQADGRKLCKNVRDLGFDCLVVTRFVTA